VLNVYFENDNCISFFNRSFRRSSFDCGGWEDTVTVTSLANSRFQIPNVTEPVQVNCESGQVTIPLHSTDVDYELQASGIFYINGSTVTIELHYQFFYQGSFIDECDETYQSL
jgi:hypothetical protein